MRGTAAGNPCPLSARVLVYVLDAYEEAEHHSANSPVTTEWSVFDWHNGHVMNDAGASTYHDGRTHAAQRLLLDFVLEAGRADFVTTFTDFLWAVIFESARAKAQGNRPDDGILNIRCKHGRHRSLGWALLITQILSLQGVAVQIFVPRYRLCSCQECNYAVDPRALRGIASLLHDIECNIAARSVYLADSSCKEHLTDYIDWVDFLPEYTASLFDP